MSTATEQILNKLDHIESMQVELLSHWQQMEDVIAELASPGLKGEIREAREDYEQGRFTSYEDIRKELDLG